MSGEQGYFVSETVIATADLDSFQYKAITYNGALASENDTTIGILQNKPKNGEAARVAYLGRVAAIAGAAITAGAPVRVTTSGYLIAVGSGYSACGKCLETSNVSSGDQFSALVNFANAITTHDGQ